jgi:hypothetical protein
LLCWQLLSFVALWGPWFRGIPGGTGGVVVVVLAMAYGAGDFSVCMQCEATVGAGVVVVAG